jgi:transcriptional regulator with XRE-family HTH domain
MVAQVGWNEASFKKAFGEVLRELRQERRLTQEALAEASDCHVNHVSFLERGINSPTLMLVFHLAAALGLPPAELVIRVEKRLRPESGAPEPGT